MREKKVGELFIKNRKDRRKRQKAEKALKEKFKLKRVRVISLFLFLKTDLTDNLTNLKRFLKNVGKAYIIKSFWFKSLVIFSINIYLSFYLLDR